MKRLPTILSGEGSKKISSKRVITLILTLTFIVVVVAHMFFGFHIDSEIYNGLVEVLIWALAFIGSEQIASAMSRRNRGRMGPNPEHDLPPRPGGDDREQF